MKLTSFILMIHLLATTALHAAEFRLVKQSGDIFLYERWIGDGDAAVRELKAVFLVRSDAPSIIGLLRDGQRGHGWNPSAREYKVLPATEPGKWINYIRYAIPWPFEDQDCCLSFHVENPLEVRFESTQHPAFPPEEGRTRLTGVRGKWLLEPRNSGFVQVQYFITTNRNRKLPRWASDPIVHSNLVKTMTQFKHLAEQ